LLTIVDYKEGHLRVARLVRKIAKDEALDGVEAEQARVLSLNASRIRAVLERGDDQAANERDEPDRTRPSIRVTTLDSAKGLQAAHVFVVGVNDRHFPKVNARPTDHEVCLMLVALTRATKCCHLISCGRPFGRAPADSGVFIRWLDGLTERVSVNKDYFGT
jgi:superfamily I DNA/RNA helicase